MEPVACLHCGLPCPGARPSSSGDGPFCCLGCALLYQVREEGEEEPIGLLTRFGLSLFFAMNIMVFALLQYSGDVFSSGPEISPLEELFRYLQLLLATPVLILLGPPLLESSLKLGWRLAGAVDLLVLVGSVAAYVASCVATFFSSGPVYFETSAGVLLFFTFGRYLDARARAQARDAVGCLLEALPHQATVLEQGVERTLDAKDVVVGARVLVRAGEMLALDGRIVSGRAAVDRSSLTGRALPECLEPGDPIKAGEIPRDGALEVEVQAPWGERVVDAVAKLLSRARLERAGVVLLADRLARILLPTALTLAVLTLGLGIWQERGAWKTCLDALAVILIACPCALGIATPLAHFVALGEAARLGALVRSGRVLDSLAQVRRVLLDKTGTLTAGHFVLSRQHGDPAGLERAAALAYASRHPISRAARIAALERGLKPAVEADAQVQPGLGVSSADAAFGAARLLAERGWTLPAPLERAAEEARQQGESLAYVGWDGQVRSLLCFQDAARCEARDSVQALRALGLGVAILSGDSLETAEAAAREVGISEVHAACSPADKAQHIAEEESRARVMFVGDGLNDGPALARASVGVAVSSGSDLARETADVLLNADLSTLPRLVKLARKTRSVVTLNLIWALGFNLAGIALAMSGRLRPLFAALAMALSSFFVVRQSLSLGTWTQPLKGPAETTTPEDADPSVGALRH